MAITDWFKTGGTMDVTDSTAGYDGVSIGPMTTQDAESMVRDTTDETTISIVPGQNKETTMADEAVNLTVAEPVAESTVTDLESAKIDVNAIVDMMQKKQQPTLDDRIKRFGDLYANSDLIQVGRLIAVVIDDPYNDDDAIILVTNVEKVIASIAGSADAGLEATAINTSFFAKNKE
jgi:hypothetical protein